jgi:hypothetical protein
MGLKFCGLPRPFFLAALTIVLFSFYFRKNGSNMQRRKPREVRGDAVGCYGAVYPSAKS